MLHVGGEVAPPQVGRQRDAEVLISIGGGQCRVGVLLVIGDIAVHADIVVVVRPVVQPVVGILGDGAQSYGAEMVLPGELGEEVLVPLAAYVGVLVGESPHDAARQSAVGEIIIGVPLQRPVEEHALDAHLVEVGVAAAACRVLVFGMIAEGIVAVGVGVLRVDEGQPLIRIGDVGLMGVERSIAVVGCERGAVGASRAEIDRRCRGIFAGCHQQFGLVGVEERHRLQSGQRVFAEVHSAVLRVGDAHAVEVNAHVLRSKRPDVDRLLPAEAAIVLDLHAGEILQRVGDIVRGQDRELLV